jgi:hypothetical protein
VNYWSLSNAKNRAVKTLAKYSEDEVPIFRKRAWDGLDYLFENGCVSYDLWDDFAVARNKLGKV